MGSSGRKIARLTLDNLDDLPSACRSCAFWELDPVQRERARQAGEVACAKEAWVSRVLLEWGSCGRILYVDEEPAGYAVYAPPSFVPGAASFPTSPVSEDAVLLSTVMVRPEFSGGGLGRVLVQSVVKDVLSRGGIKAIEVFGDRRPTEGGTVPGCVVPADFWLRVGFKTHRSHARYPRMRMEMRSVLSWREEVEQALEKLLDVVRPKQVTPAPGHAGLHHRDGRPARARPRRRAPHAGGL